MPAEVEGNPIRNKRSTEMILRHFFANHVCSPAWLSWLPSGHQPTRRRPISQQETTKQRLDKFSFCFLGCILSECTTFPLWRASRL